MSHACSPRNRIHRTTSASNGGGGVRVVTSRGGANVDRASEQRGALEICLCNFEGPRSIPSQRPDAEDQSNGGGSSCRRIVDEYMFIAIAMPLHSEADFVQGCICVGAHYRQQEPPGQDVGIGCDEEPVNYMNAPRCNSPDSSSAFAASNKVDSRRGSAGCKVPVKCIPAAPAF